MNLGYTFLLVIATSSGCKHGEDSCTKVDDSEEFSSRSNLVNFNKMWIKFLSRAPSSSFLMKRLVYIAREKKFIENLHNKDSFEIVVDKAHTTWGWVFYYANSVYLLKKSRSLVVMRRTLKYLSMVFNNAMTKSGEKLVLKSLSTEIKKIKDDTGVEKLKKTLNEKALVKFRNLMLELSAKQNHIRNRKRHQMELLRDDPMVPPGLIEGAKSNQILYDKAMTQYEEAVHTSKFWAPLLQDVLVMLVDMKTKPVLSPALPAMEYSSLIDNEVFNIGTDIRNLKFNGPQRFTLQLGTIMKALLQKMESVTEKSGLIGTGPMYFRDALASLSYVHRVGTGDMVQLRQIKDQREMVEGAQALLRLQFESGSSIKPSDLNLFRQNITKQLTFARRLANLSRMAGLEDHHKSSSGDGTTERTKPHLTIKREAEESNPVEFIESLINENEQEFHQITRKIDSINLDTINMKESVQIAVTVMKTNLNFVHKLFQILKYARKFMVKFAEAAEEFSTIAKLYQKHSNYEMRVLVKQHQAGLHDWCMELANMLGLYVKVHDNYINPVWQLALPSIPSTKVKAMLANLALNQSNIERQIKQLTVPTKDVTATRLAHARKTMAVFLKDPSAVSIPIVTCKCAHYEQLRQYIARLVRFYDKEMIHLTAQLHAATDEPGICSTQFKCWSFNNCGILEAVSVFNAPEYSCHSNATRNCITNVRSPFVATPMCLHYHELRAQIKRLQTLNHSTMSLHLSRRLFHLGKDIHSIFFNSVYIYGCIYIIIVNMQEATLDIPIVKLVVRRRDRRHLNEYFIIDSTSIKEYEGQILDESLRSGTNGTNIKFMWKNRLRPAMIAGQVDAATGIRITTEPAGYHARQLAPDCPFSVKGNTDKHENPPILVESMHTAAKRSHDELTDGPVDDSFSTIQSIDATSIIADCRARLDAFERKRTSRIISMLPTSCCNIPENDTVDSSFGNTILERNRPPCGPRPIHGTSMLEHVGKSYLAVTMPISNNGENQSENGNKLSL